MTEIIFEPSIIKRDFNAPMQLVYEAWTLENHLCQWQVPNADVSCMYKSANITTGGCAHHKMRMPSGKEMWLLTQYHELLPYHIIVFTQYESSENGEILPPSMPNWPKEIRATIKLSEANGVTSMEFTWQPINPSEGEAEAWEASRPQHGKGWGGSFELLAGYLAKVRGV